MTLQSTVDLLYRVLQFPLVDPEHLAMLPPSAIDEIRAYHMVHVREVCFVCVTGSHNYEVNDENSDIDLKATYVPRLEDFYWNSFPKFSIVTPTFDCTLAPIHQFRQHMMKGNVNFLEPLYSKAIALNPLLEDFWDTMKILVEMNVKETVIATFCTAGQQYKRFVKSVVNPEGEDTNFKAAATAMRLLNFVDMLLASGTINIVPNPDVKDLIKLLRKGDVPINEVKSMYEKYEADVRNMAFARFETGSNFEFSERAKELDGTGTTEFTELSKYADKQLINIVRENG